MTSGLKCRLLDLGFVAALLVGVAVPLLGLRGSPLLFRPESLATVFTLLAGTVALWTVFASRCRGARDATDAVPQPGVEDDRGRAWCRALLIAALLGAVTLVNFYRPLRIHFWCGGDDFLSVKEEPLLLGMHAWDAGMNRPLAVLPWAIGQAVTPGRVDGFLWLAACLCWVNGLLLFALVRELLPQARLLPAAAAVLLVIDRSEPSRFFVLYTGNSYWLAVAFLLLGVWLFLRSYRVGSRPLLALACAALGGTLMMFEVGYPLAALAPVLAWFLRQHRRRLPVWTCAWCGTLAVFAVRFLLFLADKGADAYQATLVTGALRSPRQLLSNLWLHLKAGLATFQPAGAVAPVWKAAAAALVLAAALVGVAAWRAEGAVSRRRYLLVLVVAAVALLLGTLPAMPLARIFRTQFFPAPAQAVLVAGILCLAAGLLGRRAGGAVVALVVGLLTASSTVAAVATQRHERSVSAVTFERTVHVFRQIHGICPSPSRDTLILLVPDDRLAAPLGYNYSCMLLARDILGVNMAQVGVGDSVVPPPVFHADGVTVGKPSGPCSCEAPYEKVLAFRVEPDGTVHLLQRLPTRLVRSASAAARYDPLPLLRPGPVAELRYFRYPRWAERPRDLFDMTQGVAFGEGWGPLEWRDGELSRQAVSGAELVVNPLGQKRRELRLEIEAGALERLEVFDLEGKVVASANLDGRCEIRLAVPTEPARASLIRLRPAGDRGAAATCRVFCPGGKVPSFRPAPRPTPDIGLDDLDVGGNWHSLETQNGESFRWAANDAELLVGALPAAPRQLALDVEPGPGLGGAPCRLSLQDQAGKVLARACPRGREKVRLMVPAAVEAGAVLRLHVEGGGLNVGEDARILNFRVFRCAWR